MATLQSGLTKFGYAISQAGARRRRLVILTVVALVALLSATVVIGQASQNYAISCGYVISSGGGSVASANFGVIGSLGNPIVPPNTAPGYAVRSTNFSLHAGFLPSTSNTAAAASSISPNVGNAGIVTHMPFIANMIASIIGSCVPPQAR